MYFDAMLVSRDEISSEARVDTEDIPEVYNLHVQFTPRSWQVHVLLDESLIVVYLFKLEYVSLARPDNKVPALLLLLQRTLSQDVSFHCGNQLHSRCLEVLDESLSLIEYTACLAL